MDFQGDPLLTIDDDRDELETLYQRSVDEIWGDGLPVIPPTRERVRRALEAIGASGDRTLGHIPPSNAAATERLIAVNAVMAGCRPEHLPVVFAAVEAMCMPEFNLAGLQLTTNPVAVGGFISGPFAAAAGVNGGLNALGPGNRANASIGRALRLILRNIGGQGSSERSTMGAPAKYTFFFGEADEPQLWDPWRVRNGFGHESTVVTVFGISGYLNLLETTTVAEELIEAIAVSMTFPTSNDHLLRGEPFLLLCPEHARVLHASGYSMHDIQQAIWQRARIPVRQFSESSRRYRLVPNWRTDLGELAPETQIPLAVDPDHIRILVVGGPGKHSVYLPSVAICRASSALVQTE